MHSTTQIYQVSADKRKNYVIDKTITTNLPSLTSSSITGSISDVEA
jgi:hypothetical protein